MEDSQGGLNVDFDGGLEAAPANSAVFGSVIQSDSLTFSNGGASRTSVAAASEPAEGNGLGRGLREEVCRHWLGGHCENGDHCRFLHKDDKDRYPVCQFFTAYGKCPKQDCIYKHTNEDIKEFKWCKWGVCLNGPDCQCGQAKKAGPTPPIDEVFQKIQYPYSDNYHTSNKSFQPRGAGYPQQVEKSQFPQGPNS
ncbi:30-kDa cleavage and polyadenylation specificity factor 30 [Quillaja saponaria]|uniref:30-kDa cleavage and polyadenylation specificity factor 30 n=1 Tax=Quillaja saponaria TaxID=32244 RepID=A0AAD7M329_QUISA|nr:30-kDa cleavage and polyadenylation specificity factor 30 [Quillaja saponaria]